MREMQATSFRRMPIVEMGRDGVIEVKSRETVLGHWVPQGQRAAFDERVSVVAILREVCRDYGDNDWADDLHLYDVIEKHLARHLYNHVPPLNEVEGDEDAD